MGNGFIQGYIDGYLSRLSDEELLELVRQHVLGRITAGQKLKLAQMVAQEAGGTFQAYQGLRGLSL